MRTVVIGGWVGVLVLGVGTPFATGDEVPDGPVKELLLRPFPATERNIEFNLKDSLDWIQKQTGLRVEVDEQAFAAVKRRPPIDEDGLWREMRGVRTDVSLDLFLRRFEVDVRIGKERILLVPKGQGRSILLPPGRQEQNRANEIRRRLSEPFSNEKRIDGAPLESVLEFIGLRAGLSVNPGLDDAVFKRHFPKRSDIGQQPVVLPECKDVPVGTVLADVLKQVGGTYRVTDHGMILIDPIPNQT